jgi:hypothetical protein
MDFNIKIEDAGLKQGISSAVVYHHHRTSLKGLFHQRFRYGWVASRFIWKYGPWHARYWPLFITSYWTCVCLIKRKPQYIPYFITDFIAQSAGMIKGFMALFTEAGNKKVESK